MKIIYLHQFFKFPESAGGTRSYDLATGFISKGHTVEILAASSDAQFQHKDRWSRVKRDGLIIHFIYIPYSNELKYWKRILVFLKFIFFASVKLLNLKADLVLASSTPLTIGIPALIKKWRDKTPFIFEVRDVWPEAVIAVGAIKNKLVQRVLFRLERLLYKNAAAIVPLSTDMKRSIVDRYPELDPRNIFVIENISAIDRFQRSDYNQDVLERCIGFVPRFSVLYAGTFGKVNGISYVIELAEKVRAYDDSIVFILIGHGSERLKVIESAKQKGLLNETVFILDAVAKDELPRLYANVQMGSSFVLPIEELWANSANKFFDTLASGKPILINHGGWQKDEIKLNQMGYVLPFDLTDVEVEKFVMYSKDSELLLMQGQNALKRAKERYSLPIALEKYHHIIRNINV